MQIQYHFDLLCGIEIPAAPLRLYSNGDEGCDSAPSKTRLTRRC